MSKNDQTKNDEKDIAGASEANDGESESSPTPGKDKKDTPNDAQKKTTDDENVETSKKYSTDDSEVGKDDHVKRTDNQRNKTANRLEKKTDESVTFKCDLSLSTCSLNTGRNKNETHVSKCETLFPKCAPKCTDEQYIDLRESVRTMMYLIDKRDRARVSAWLDRLEKMVDDEGQLERLIYIKYLAVILSGSAGLLEPFNSAPPEVIRPLNVILPSVVLADLMDERLNEDPCVRRRADYMARASMTPAKRTPLEDYQFFEQQLFPPEGMFCYAAAFSTV